MQRVYVDKGPLVRFDFGIFTNPSHTASVSSLSLTSVAKRFWTTPVHLKRTHESLALNQALEPLLRQFRDATAARASQEACQLLTPQLQVIAPISSKRARARDWITVDDEQAFRFQTSTVRVRGWRRPVPLVAIGYEPGYVTRPTGKRFRTLRWIRSQLSWLHSDLEILERVIRDCVQRGSSADRAETYAVTVSGRLEEPRRLYPRAGLSPERVRILRRLFHNWLAYESNRISRLHALIQNSSLSLDSKERLAGNLRSLLVSRDMGELSTPEDRSRYARKLYQLGAVSESSAVASKEISEELGFIDDIREDVETFLSAAGLVSFVTFGPTVCLTHEGRLWVEERNAALDSPPARSHTQILNIGAGARVGAVQLSGQDSSQATHVVVNKTEAVRAWAGDAREWVTQATQLGSEVRSGILMELDDLDTELASESPDLTKTKRLVIKVRELLQLVGVAAGGSLTAEGLIEAAAHLEKLL